MADQHLFSTELLGLSVYDLRRRKIGRVKDAAIVPLVNPLRVDRYLVGGGFAWLSIRYDQVQSISLAGIYLRDEVLTPFHADEYLLRLRRDLLDQQIIDAHGRKVIRVNDVTFDIVEENGIDTLRVREVDVGVRSMLRRLLQGVVPPRWVRRMQGPIAPNSIAWEYCNIIEPDPQRRLRLNYSAEQLEKLHPADLADIVEELSHEDREAVIESLHSDVAAETLSEVDPDIQASILESLDTEKAAEIVEEMSPSEAAHALAELQDETSEEILEEMDPEPKTELQELLEYEEDTAGYLMNTEYISLLESMTVAEALPVLRENAELLEATSTVFLVDREEALCGSVPLSRLLLAPPDSVLQSLITDQTISVDAEDNEEHVVELFDKYSLLALPVLAEGRLTGAITADDVISVLRHR